MARRVRDFIEISDYTSLDRLITTLTAIRNSLPPGAEPEMKLKGDDHFGHRLSISYLRQLTEEEARCDARYIGDVVTDVEPAIESLRSKLDQVPFERTAPKRPERVRKVA